MPIGEGYRPFQPQGVKIPIENVGVRLSGRRPGERRLNLVKPPTPEQPKTLFQEMRQYITTRQSLRDHGYFFLRGKEPANISLADATHNDLFAIMYDDKLSDTTRQIREKGNHVRMRKVFDAYAMQRFSPEMQREILEEWEGMYEFNSKEHNPVRVTQLTPVETETVTWLLSRMGVPFETPPEGFKESYASLLFRMRTATANQQPEWKQEQKTIQNIYHFARRR